MKEYINGALSLAFWILMGYLTTRTDNWSYVGLGAFVAMVLWVSLVVPINGKIYPR